MIGTSVPIQGGRVTPAELGDAARARRIELGLRQQVLDVLGFRITLTEFDALRPGVRA